MSLKNSAYCLSTLATIMLLNGVGFSALPATVCGKPLTSSISRFQLSERIKAASRFRQGNSPALVKKTLGLQDDDALLLRMPAIQDVYAGTNVPTFRPETDTCRLTRDKFADMPLLGAGPPNRFAGSSCVRVTQAGEKQSPYEAQNAFGAKVTVSRVKFTNVHIFMGYSSHPDGMHEAIPELYGLPSDVGLWYTPSERDDPLRTPMSKAEEVDWRRNGNKYLLLHVRKPFAFWQLEGQAATYSSPSQEEQNDYYLIADVMCIGIINSRNGAVVPELHLPITQEQALQRAQSGLNKNWKTETE